MHRIMTLRGTLTPADPTLGALSPNLRSGGKRVRDARTILMRAAWLIVALLALGLFALGVPARFDEMRGQYQGQVGLDLSRNSAGQIVLTPSWQGAAAAAGILSGDILVAVDGVPVPHDRSIPAGSMIPAGEAGSKLTLQVRTPGFAVRRAIVMRAGDDGFALAQLGLSSRFLATYVVAIDIAVALLFGAIAAVLIWRRADDWLVVLVSATLLMVFLGLSLPVIALYRVHSEWQPVLDVWIALGFAALCAVFYLFPDGRTVTRGMVLLTGVLVLWTLVELLYPGLYPWKQGPITFFLILLGWLVTGVFAQLYRFRFRADAVQRQQTKWIVFGASAAALGIAAEIWHVAWFQQAGGVNVAYDLAVYPVSRFLTALLPLSIGVAILRYRLWDIDIIINRALVYGSLTAGVVGLYILIVGGSSALLQSQGNLIISLFATGVIAILFHPMRERLQIAVNHLLYGERDEPYTVLSRLGQRLGVSLAPDSLLSTIVTTVAEALKVPYAALAVTRDGSLVLESAYGSPSADPLVLPLVHQTRHVGQLIVAPRAPGDVFSPADRRLLEDLAREISVTVDAMLLTVELQRSRERLVTAREEERRRLRRDLHDGLGPALASMLLKIAAARRVLEPESPVDALLAEVRSDMQEAVADIRRLVHALRPPVLDELGLLAALRQQAVQTTTSTVQVTVEAPERLPALSAAVEVASYRIAQEALTNVVRHAEASRCTLRLTLDATPHGTVLDLQVIDNGRGFAPDARQGVGTSSMRERVEELGGVFSIAPNAPSGTVICARIPLPHEEIRS